MASISNKPSPPHQPCARPTFMRPMSRFGGPAPTASRPLPHINTNISAYIPYYLSPSSEPSSSLEPLRNTNAPATHHPAKKNGSSSAFNIFRAPQKKTRLATRHRVNKAPGINYATPNTTQGLPTRPGISNTSIQKMPAPISWQLEQQRKRSLEHANTLVRAVAKRKHIGRAKEVAINDLAVVRVENKRAATAPVDDDEDSLFLPAETASELKYEAYVKGLGRQFEVAGGSCQ